MATLAPSAPRPICPSALSPASAPLESYRLRVPPDGGAELESRMAYYGLQWAGKRMSETLQRWAAAGGSPPIEDGGGGGGGVPAV
jgi:hypothetical protein